MTEIADFAVTNHGSIFALKPQTEAASDWVAAHIPDDAQWWGDGVVVEHRYISDIVACARLDGLTVEED